MGLPIHQLILATNENDVLDEFFRNARYRVRKGEEVHQTSSPSMDISKASNFERFIYDLSGGNATQVVRLWGQVDVEGGFDLSGTDLATRLPQYGFVSGNSSHADRMATIRMVHRDFGVTIDTHTADGVKVGLERRDPKVPLICLETAQPAKFAEAVREALGTEPEVPDAFRGIERLPQRVEVMDADVHAVKAFIAAHCGD
jgi:threonine synthase